MRTGRMLWLTGALMFTVPTSAPARQFDLPRHLSTAEVRAFRRDLDSLDRALRSLHPSPWHTVSAADFREQRRVLASRLPRMTRERATAELARLVAGIGDGHTALPLLGDGHATSAPFTAVPLRFFAFADGIFIVAADSANRSLIGAEVVRVGRVRADSALAVVSGLVSRDNLWTVRERAPALLGSPRLAYALEFARHPDTLELELRIGGGQTRAKLTTSNRHLAWVEGGPLRQSSADGSQEFRNFGMRFDQSVSALIVRYDRVADDPAMTVAQFAALILETARARRPARVILDLRRNSGGSGLLNLPLLHTMIRLDTMPARRWLFVLTGRQTFSAATALSLDLMKHTSAVFVGEPGGGSPYHYGDHRPVTLPGSGLTVMIATVFWQAGWPWQDRVVFAPNEPVPLVSADFFAGRDAVLARALSMR